MSIADLCMNYFRPFISMLSARKVHMERNKKACIYVASVV